MVIPIHQPRSPRVRLWTRRAGAMDGGHADTGTAVVRIGDEGSTDVALVGAKAANLAVARVAGMPVLPGFVLPVGHSQKLTAFQLDELHAVWRELTADGRDAVVVRSSAIAEDGAGSSMAGRFESVLDVRGWRAFLAAVAQVTDSAAVVSLDGTGTVERHDMAVLVQPFLAAVAGGVLFGADPVSGRLDRFALAAVDGGPDQLVGGDATGTHELLTRRGRVVSRDGAPVAALSAGHARRRLAALARRAAEVFGGPQDVEWAIDGEGRLWLLQSRPVTTLAGSGGAEGVTGAGRGRKDHGPLFGPGPVAETFPDPLTTLEQQLWLDPLRAGMVHALALTGGVSRRRLDASPVVIAVGGRAAVDLDLVGAAPQRRSLWAHLDPRPPARRLRAAWRTGRLRRAMPALAAALVDEVDRELASVPPLNDARDDALVGLLHGSRRLLVALHGQEVLAGLLLGTDATAASAAGGAAMALRALAAARAAGEPEERIPALHPAVLALVPPAIRPATLPPCTAVLPDSLPTDEASADPTRPEVFREELRLRARWVQELGAVAAWELGARLARRGTLNDAADVRHLTIDELAALLAGSAAGAVPVIAAPGAPLPAVFHLDGEGRPVTVSDANRAGQGAGGGRREGRVVHDVDAAIAATEPVVLVTPTLAPQLATVLPSLAGIVAETGSVLSHLAILARELGVATVVGVADAAARFPAGAYVIVDGATGGVEVVDAVTTEARGA